MVGPNGCAFCGKLYITVPPPTEVGEDFGEGLEVEAYLPCGHKFGHRCLNRYMQALKHEETQPGETQPTRCPWGNCLPLLHRCGHMCTPQRTPPTPLSPQRIMTDKNLPVLHGFCEFCLSDEGYSICQRIGKHRKRRLHHLESSVSSSFLERPFHKASVQYFRIRQRKELQNLDKAVLAHEHSRARNFYNQWLIESRRSQEHRSRTSSRNSQTQGDGTKSQPRENDQPWNKRPQETQSRGTQEQDSQAQGSQIPDHSRRTSIAPNNLPGDSQPGHSLAELIRGGQQSTLRRQSVAHPETLEQSAKERRILDEMMSLKEPEEVTSMDQVQESYKRKAEEKMAEDGGEVKEEEQAQKEGKGKGKAKAVRPYHEPMSKRRGSV
ncbi:hypothetical protein CEP54_010144 [Fusarium duplospermum]|uniref:Uncharacterized protein n=1 Tax=Fusarium duplospermum TaxID=1325734 RepID=A0A428PLU8_9HYPO|nr:hypothetical protein CEP54_010144 [Fusarium duplospermum]